MAEQLAVEVDVINVTVFRGVVVVRGWGNGGFQFTKSQGEERERVGESVMVRQPPIPSSPPHYTETPGPLDWIRSHILLREGILTKKRSLSCVCVSCFLHRLQLPIAQPFAKLGCKFFA